jgi:hypothetical protein
VTITRGSAVYGGGIYNDGGTLTVTNSTFTDKTAPPRATRCCLEDVDTLGNVTRHGPAEAPAYRFRPIPRPMPPDGVLNHLVDLEAPAVDAARVQAADPYQFGDHNAALMRVAAVDGLAG